MKKMVVGLGLAYLALLVLVIVSLTRISGDQSRVEDLRHQVDAALGHPEKNKPAPWTKMDTSVSALETRLSAQQAEINRLKTELAQLREGMPGGGHKELPSADSATSEGPDHLTEPTFEQLRKKYRSMQDFGSNLEWLQNVRDSIPEQERQQVLIEETVRILNLKGEEKDRFVTVARAIAQEYRSYNAKSRALEEDFAEYQRSRPDLMRQYQTDSSAANQRSSEMSRAYEREQNALRIEYASDSNVMGQRLSELAQRYAMEQQQYQNDLQSLYVRYYGDLVFKQQDLSVEGTQIIQSAQDRLKTVLSEKNDRHQQFISGLDSWLSVF